MFHHLSMVAGSEGFTVIASCALRMQCKLVLIKARPEVNWASQILSSLLCKNLLKLTINVN